MSIISLKHGIKPLSLIVCVAVLMALMPGVAWATDIPVTVTVSDPSTTGFTVGLDPAVGDLVASDFTLKDDTNQDVTITNVATTDSGATYTVSADLTAGKTYTVNITKTGYDFGGAASVVVPAPTTYNITVADVVGGTATVSADKTTAAENETVTVTISNIESGKRFKSITVVDADNQAVTTTEVTAGQKYTFTMPAKAVTVTVELEAVPAPSIANVNPTTLTEAAANDGSIAAPGTITVTIANGTLAADIAKTDITAANLPTGLDYTVTRDSETQLTIALTGKADNHAAANSVSNLTFTIPLAKVAGATSDLTTGNISITFSDPAADKDALDAAIAAAQVLVEADYTPLSWQAVATALTNAVAVQGKEDATQEEVDGATTALTTAMDKLDYNYSTVGIYTKAGLQATVTATVTDSRGLDSQVTVIFQLMDGNAPVQQVALAANMQTGQEVSAIFNLPENKVYTCKILVWDSLSGQMAKADPTNVSIE
ncbi:MAG: hypothetical protein GXX09_12655 [Syntrophomonadaceae bacterium]|nr:hypothetical protein [Syntrophomonadaceae bacterium]